MTFARKLVFVAAACLAFLLATPARADEASEANLQYELGSELYKQKRYGEALERFIASHRLVPNAKVAFNIAALFEYLKRPKDAYNWFVRTSALANDDELRAMAEAALARLAPGLAVVSVETNPAGAELFVERVDLGSVGKSPMRLAVDPGRNRVIARKAGFREAIIDRDVTVGQTLPIPMDLAPLVGRVHVTSTPPGAHVRLEKASEELGTTPLDVDLPIGEQRLVVTSPGHVEQIRSVVVTDGEAVKVEARLERAASTVAVLTLGGNVEGVTVLLDGRSVGLAPTSLPNLDPGKHRLELRAPERTPWTTDLLLEAGAATRVDYTLVDPRDRTWPGYRAIGYGTGAALVIAGAIVGAFALQAHGDFDQNPSSAALDKTQSLNVTTDVLLGSGAAVLLGTLLWDVFRKPDPVSGGKVSVDR